MAKPQHVFKVLMLGDSAVGKTSILSKLSDGSSAQLSTMPSMGIDVRKCSFTIGGTKCKLQIWDTAGQERFLAVTRSFYRDAQAVALCYDVTSRASFRGVERWLREIRDASPQCELILIGNKADLVTETPAAREVTKATGQALAAELHIPFFETSALTGANIDAAFRCLTARTLARVTGAPMPPLPTGAGATTSSAVTASGGAGAMPPGGSSRSASSDSVATSGGGGAGAPAWLERSPHVDIAKVEEDTARRKAAAEGGGGCAC